MIIYQAQPNRAFPAVLPFLKNCKNPIGYEFSTQFIFNSEQDYESMYNNKYIYYHSEPLLVRSSMDEKFNPISIRLKDKYNTSLEEEIKVDYFHGLFESKYLDNKKESDFSFTIIDHPINQILNLFNYIKYMISYEDEIREYGYLLNKNEEELTTILKEHKVDVDTFEVENLDQDSFNYKYTKDFYIDFLQFKNKKTKEEAIESFQDIYARYYIYTLICSTSLKNISSEHEWIDYFISNPSLKDLISFQNKKFTYPLHYLYNKHLHKNHDFYGVMDSRRNLLKSLYVISKKSQNLFFGLNPKFTDVNPMNDFTYRAKDLNSIFEEDIEIFMKSKEALEKADL